MTGRLSVIRNFAGRARAWTKRFLRAERGATAVVFGLTLVSVILAGGVGLDMGRAMVLKNRMAEALDAAGLAVGSTTGLTNDQMQTMAQNYFNANYPSSALGTPGNVSVSVGGTNGSTITLSVTGTVPTTLMELANIHTLSVNVTSKITKSLTKLWVSLVLDNTGSMTQTDGTGTSKISALITATNQLLATLQNAASNPGDVEVAIIPFSKTVNVGTSNVNASWIDWTDWEAAPPSSTPSSNVGPGSNCPYGTTTSPYGYGCASNPTNGSTTITKIPSSPSAYSSGTTYSNGQQVTYSGSTYVYIKSSSSSGHTPSSGSSYWQLQSADYTGYICPGVDNGGYYSSNDHSGFNTGRNGHYWNGCYNSVGTTSTSTSSNTTTTNTTLCTNKTSCTVATYCGGYPTNNTTTSGNTTTVTNTTCQCVTTSGTKKTCTTTATAVATTTTTTTGAPYTHTWIKNAHGTWDGCIEDRTQDYDTNNTTPSGTSTNFPAENTTSCVPSVMQGTLSYNWSSLTSTVNAMTAGGSTNQTIGLAWGWQAFTGGNPLNAGTLPANTSRVIILLSDGLNTQDRWYGNGTDQSSSVDTRMSDACSNAKTAGVIVYTVFVDLNGTQGSSSALSNCATDSSHYFDLTTSGQIVTTFNQIGQTLANLHIAQ